MKWASIILNNMNGLVIEVNNSTKNYRYNRVTYATRA